MTETLTELFVPGFGGLGLHFQLDGFRLIYVLIALWMWAVSGIFSREYMAHYEKRGRYYVFFWFTLLATLGVFLSASLFTTFLFFEVMSFTSYVWVAFDQRPESLRAAETYLAVAVIGGLVMLMGLFLLYNLCGTLEMDAVSRTAGEILSGESENDQAARVWLYAAGGLLLFGFGAKAGMFPLHIWLPKAHPVAPAPASALLSGILTKAGVFGIIFVSCCLFGSDWGWGNLITVLGLVTMVLGAVLALFSTNLKRTLACSSVSQIGFILTGIGMAVLLKWAGESNLLAVRGAFLHMVNHSLLKLVLFLCAGVVFMNLHELDLNEIRGFGRKKPALLFCFLMGALGIGGMPLWNGYISKTLIHEGIVEYMEFLRENPGLAGESMALVLPFGRMLLQPGLWKLAEWLFLVSGGMTVAYMTKLFVVLFVDRHPTRQREFEAMSGTYMRPASRFVLVASAVLLPCLGLFPHQITDRLADMGQGFFGSSGQVHQVAYFHWESLKGGLISLGLGAILYVAFVRGLLMRRDGEKAEGREPVYLNRWPAWLDLEELIYRPVLTVFLPGVLGAVCQILDRHLIPTLELLFIRLFSVVGRSMDQAVDGSILLARKTTHSQISAPREAGEGNWLAHILGPLADGFFFLGDSLTGRRRKKGPRKPHVYFFVEREKRAKHVLNLVEESFSFGLMLVCVGLCLTLGYLLFVFVWR